MTGGPLPTPGADDDVWGEKLNTSLEASLDPTTGKLLPAAVQTAITAQGSVSTPQVSLGSNAAQIQLGTDSSGNPQIVESTFGSSPTSTTLDAAGFRPSNQGSPPIPLGTPASPWSSLTVNALSKLPLAPDGSPIVSLNQMNQAIASAIQGSLTVPGPPTSLGATSGSNSVSLSWTAPSNTGGSSITGYAVRRSTVSGQEQGIAIIGNVTSYTDSTAVNGTTYFYNVEAANAQGNSTPSNEASATPRAANTVPSAPGLSSAVASPGQVVLTWTAPINNGGTSLTSYSVLRGTTSGGETVLASGLSPSSLTYTDTSVTNDTTYFYEVEAVNSVGTSAASNELSATPNAASMSAPTGFTTSELTFEENFLSGTLDSTKWTVGVGTPVLWQNNGNLPNPYSGGNMPGDASVAVYHPNQVTISGGICTFTAQLAAGTYVPTSIQNQGYTWVSGALTTLTKFQISTIQAEQEWYFQCRCQFPDTSAGMFPAIWFLPSDGSQELDMIEGGWQPNQTGNNWPANTQIHTDLFAPPGSQNQPIFRPLAGGDYTTGYHIYGLHFIPGNSITWFVDGTQVQQILNSQSAFSAKAYSLLLTLQVAAPSTNGWHTTGGTATRQWLIDEIQIYAK